MLTLQWRHNELHGVSNHQPHDCLLNRLFRRRSKRTSKLCVTGLCAWNSPVTGEFPAQMASNAENVSIWWRHHEGLSSFISWWGRYLDHTVAELQWPPFWKRAFSNLFSFMASIIFGPEFHRCSFARDQFRNMSALVQIMAWCRTGDNRLSEPTID